MEEYISSRLKFAGWCRQVKARRAENRTPEGHARLASLIVQARETADELRGIAEEMVKAADGIGRGAWYAHKAGEAVDHVDSLLDCVEEQLEREAVDGYADG